MPAVVPDLLSTSSSPTPIPVPVDVPGGFWKRETTHAPQPHYPLNRIVFPLRRRAIERACAELGLLMQGIDMREIGGWEYMSMVPVGGAKDGPAPPRWLMWLAVRLHPTLRQRLRQCADAHRSGKVGELIHRYWNEWRPGLQESLEHLRAFPLEEAGVDELDAHLDSVYRMFEHAIDVHFHVALPSMISVGQLALACRDLLGWDDTRTLALLGGLSERSSAPYRAMIELARAAGARPPVVEILAQDPTMEQIARVDRDFCEQFERYVETWGRRALRYDVGEATLAECPELLIQLIRNQLRRRYDAAASATALEAAREDALARAREQLESAGDADRVRFEKALELAKQGYPVREDNVFYTVGAPMAVVRRSALELGRRLVRQGFLETAEDVFFLEWDEARAVLRHPADQRALVARRKAERAWVLAHPGPDTYGRDPGPPPDFSVLPEDARAMMQALLHSLERVAPDEHTMPENTRDAPTVQGTPAATGRYTGTVRVIASEDEFAKLQPGDVLVCPITSPVWSVLFPSVGALVTDTGGVLSHPAIIAREFRVPAVVATRNATSLLKDGDIVTVDGDAGTVRVQR